MDGTVSLDAQFERIHGELALVNTKLDHEAEWRANELTGLRASIEDLKITILSVKDHADRVGNVVRNDLEKQVSDVVLDLDNLDAEVRTQVKRIDAVTKRTDNQDGALAVLRWFGGGVGTVTCGLVVYALTHGLWH